MAKESFESFFKSNRQMRKAQSAPGNFKFPGKPVKSQPTAVPEAKLPPAKPEKAAAPAQPEISALPAKRGRPRKNTVTKQEAAKFAAEMTPVGSSNRLPCGLLTPRTRYAELILKALAKAPNYAMKTGDVIKMIAKKMYGKFTEADLTELPNGQVRWFNNVQWTRKRLVVMKLLEPTLASGRGIWQLSRDGIETVKSL